MVLAGCPSCGGRVDISAQACVHCGREFLGVYRDHILCLACCWPGQKKEECTRCGATGRRMVEGHFLIKCFWCKGEGKRIEQMPIGWRVWQRPEAELKTCLVCKGTGKTILGVEAF